MPNPIGGGYQVPGDLGQRLVGTEKAVAQLQRLMTQPPKTPKPPVGGGIVDLASVYTGATVGIAWPSGAPDLDFSTAAYTAQSKEGDTSWLSITGGDIAVTQDGYYQAWCWFNLRWPTLAGAPGEFLSLYIGGDPSSAAPDGIYFPIQKAGLTWGVVNFITNGPEYLTAGQYWRLEADGDGPSSADIVRSGASWRITRYA